MDANSKGSSKPCLYLISQQHPQILEWLNSRLDNPLEASQCRTLAAANENEIIAVSGYSGWDGHNVEISVAIDKPISRRVLRFAFDYPFQQLGAHRVFIRISDINKRSLALAKRLGFVKEGTLREASPDGDVHIFSMLQEEYENKWAVQA